MTVQEYIAELLFDYNRLIIPDFGAFIGTPRSAKIDEENKQVLPPSKDLLFNDKLIINDELLISKIAEQEGIVKQAAVEKVKLFVTDLKEKLDLNKTVSFEKLGNFVQKPSGEIVFNQDENVNFLNDAFGLNSVDLTQKNEIAAVEQVAGISALPETNEVVEENELFERDNDILEEQIENEIVEDEVLITENEVIEESEPIIEENEIEEEQVEVIEEETIVAEEISPSNSVAEKVEESVTESKQEIVNDVVDDGSGFKWWYAVLPLLALLIGGFFVWQLISKGSENPYAKKQETSTIEKNESIAKQTPTITDSVNNTKASNIKSSTAETNSQKTEQTKASTASTNKTEETKSTSSTNTNTSTNTNQAVTNSFSPIRGYYVIIGSIKGSSTAQSDASKWKKKGYEAHVLPGPNGYSRIGLFVGKDKSEATNKLSNYKKEIISSAWLLQN